MIVLYSTTSTPSRRAASRERYAGHEREAALGVGQASEAKIQA